MADTMNSVEYAHEWLHFAEMDLSTAEYILGHRPLPVEIICYHCQQSAEKCLKGLLVLNERRPPKTHELDELYQLCEPFVPNLQNIWKQCGILNRYASMPRYPRELDITEQDMHTAIKSAKTIMDFIRPFYVPQETPTGKAASTTRTAAAKRTATSTK
jgi:HEPN domain-containing protein